MNAWVGAFKLLLLEHLLIADICAGAAGGCRWWVFDIAEGSVLSGSLLSVY